ncbi:acyltransferase family protein [Microbacterium sp. TS-1]|uniref:acyltransferase family protein n=1 Tax=Microbacterium sp. TS-1 TaxID=1344956 RepID=UPI0009DEC6DF|nr:acyltransferase family protein [Microbacterium sp. TS-1]
MTATSPSNLERSGDGQAGGKFRPDVQGLRALAVLLVLLYHASIPGFGGGFVGVDIFFVISGFLITTHLLESKLKTGRIGFVRFYARRVQRLLPAAVTVIVLTAAAGLVFVPRVMMPDELLAAVAALLYVPNMYFAYRGSDYLAGGTDSLFQQFWSLGVEEQFYLIWPLLVAGLVWFARKRLSLVTVMILGLAIASFSLCLVTMGSSQPWAFYSLPTRAWELAVGGIVATVLVSSRSWAKWLSVTCAWVGLVMIVASVVVIDANAGFPAPWAVLPVAGTALLIFGGARGVVSPVTRLLSISPAQRLGDISYSVYLVHWPMLLIPELASGDELPFWGRVLVAAVAVPAGWVLYRTVETPLRHRPALRSAPKRVVAFAVASALVLSGAAVVTRALVERAPYGSSEVAISPPSPEEFPLETEFVPANVRPGLMGARDDNASVYSSPCHQTESETGFQVCAFGDVDSPVTVVLFGDSHAANWFPALETIARERGIRLESYSKSSCSSNLVAKKFQGRAYWECDQWRAAVLDHLREESPDMIILSNFSPSSTEPTSFVDQSRPTAEVWADGTRRAIDAMPSSSDVVVIEDTPRQLEDPVLCLSRHLNDAAQCATSSEAALRADVAAQEHDAVEAVGRRYIDLNDYLCNLESCPVVIGDMLVYRDAHHLTATFSKFLTPALESRLFPAQETIG